MEKKEQIILAAMQLLVQQDIQATSMSMIAKAAKTGMGTIYNYFKTKEELINAVFVYILEHQRTYIHKRKQLESLKKEFDHYYLIFNKYWLQHPDHFFFIDQFERSPIITEESRKESIHTIKPIVELLEDGQAQGEIKIISIDELIKFLNGGILYFIRWILIESPQNVDDLLRNQLKLAWDAIRA